MTLQIPTAKKEFLQPNNTDNEGNLYSTVNCDFESNAGVLQIAKKLLVSTRTADVPTLTGVPVGFRYFNNGSSTSVYTCGGSSNIGNVYSSLVPSATFAQVNTSGAPTTLDSSTSDIETAFSELYITNASEAKIYYLNGSNVWANFAAGAAGSTMMLCFFPALQRVYVTKNGNVIQSFDSSHTVTSSGPNSLTLGLGEVITFMKAASNVIWIGTVNIYGGKGYIYQWDGSSTQVQKSYKVEAAGALSCVIKNDVPHVIDSNGNYLIWNGGTFVKQTGFNRKNSKQLFGSAQSLNNRFIHPNGMAIVEDQVNALVDLTNQDAAGHTGTQEDCNPSGIWVYTQLTATTGQLRHKFAATLGKAGDTIKDYAQFRIWRAGGLAQLLNSQNLSNGTILAGMGYLTDAVTSTFGIFYEDTNDTIMKAASFVSPIVASATITSMWQKAIAFHDKFASATDRIVVRVRHIFDTSTEATISWTTTTAFTVSGVDLSTYKKGDEVDVLAGIGAGLPSSIVSIQQGSGSNVWIVKVDEIYTGATGTSIARFTKWKKIGTIKDTADFGEAPINNAAARIQIKVWLTWTGRNLLSKILVPNAPSK